MSSATRTDNKMYTFFFFFKPTFIFKILKFLQNLRSLVTVMLGNAHDHFGCAGEGDDVEFQGDFITVQLRDKFTFITFSRHNSDSLSVVDQHVESKLSRVDTYCTLPMRLATALLASSKFSSLMLPELSIRINTFRRPFCIWIVLA